MTPDFEYFIRMKVQSNFSHTLPGLLWFDLPLGLLLCFIYHSFVRNSLIDNSPTILRERLDKYKTFDWKKYFSNKWFIVCISILIGSASHLFWDSFTHENGFFVERISIFKKPVHLGNLTVPFFKLVQHLSSLIGGLIIVFALLSMRKTTTTTNNESLKYWSLIFLISLTVVVIRLLNGLHLYQYGNLIVTIISGVLAALIVAPLMLKRV